MARQGNILLGFPNRIDQATLSGGSWVPSLPRENLQNRLFAKVARTVNLDPSNCRVVLDFGQPRAIDVVGLIAHNISLAGKVLIESSNTADFSVIRNILFKEVWTGVSDGSWVIEDLEWENDNYWLGTYSNEEIEGFTSISIQPLMSFRSARYWRITITDPENTDGYIQIGRIFIGPGVQPEINYSFGSSLGFESATVVETALGGAEFFDVREPLRIFRFSLEYMKDSEGYGKFLNMTRRLGIHGEVLVVPDPDDLSRGLVRNFIGRMRQMNVLEQIGYVDGEVANSMTFEIKETR